jgi:hypothetical protein
MQQPNPRDLRLPAVWFVMRQILIKRTPSQAELRELFHYDPETGVFTHLQTRGKGKKGATVGKVNMHGYVEMRVFNKLFGAHRLAFLYMTGELPVLPFMVDHINGSRSDNRWINLRIADYQQQVWNTTAHHHNQSGLKGAWPCKTTGRWQSIIQDGAKRVWLGRFDTAEEAHQAWIKAATELRGAEWVQRASAIAA